MQGKRKKSKFKALYHRSVTSKSTAEQQPKTGATCARFSKFPPLQSDRCEPSGLWADGLSSRLEGGALGEDGEWGLVMMVAATAPGERMKGGEIEGESRLGGSR